MIKGREAKSAPSTDLLVCFPSRAHLNLTLMPKPICSPARPSDSNKRHHNNHHLKKSTTRGGGGQASPVLWNKTKSMGAEISEPTSPKVTCAGQIKVRPKTSACRSWQSVMEEIEKIHSNKNQRKKPSRPESVGFKKDIMQFLTCLRRIRFDLRCLGTFPEADVTTDDEDEEDEDEKLPENHEVIEESENVDSRTVFSKWFMVLQENQNNEFPIDDRKNKNKVDDDENKLVAEPAVPPPNALLLMRCRSAPAKSWSKENAEEENEEDEEKEEAEAEAGETKKVQTLRSLMDEERRKKENLVVMRHDPDFYKISSDIAEETWIVGGLRDSLCKSRSWKR